jgi:hypothetical protein
MRRIALLICYCFALSVASAQTTQPTVTGAILDVSTPIAGAVYQRSNNGNATIVVSGMTRSGAAATIFSAFATNPMAVFKPLSIVDGSPTGGASTQFSLTRTGNTFSGSGSVPAGWYELSVTANFLDFGGSIIQMINPIKVGVGEVFIIAGQSNAQGLPNVFKGQIDPDGKAYTADDINTVREPLTYDAVRVQPWSIPEDKFIPNFINLANTNLFFSILKPFLLSGQVSASSVPEKGIAPTGLSLWY